MAKSKMVTAEPWSVPAAKGANRNVQRSSDKRKANAGGGNNPKRSTMNRNATGSHKDPFIKGAPNRSRTTSEIAKLNNDPLLNRNPGGSFEAPKYSTAEPKKRSYKK